MDAAPAYSVTALSIEAAPAGSPCFLITAKTSAPSFRFGLQFT
ncbi:hypothetical protein ABZ478_35740 [Streptomyces sp. NPDC005706]